MALMWAPLIGSPASCPAARMLRRDAGDCCPGARKVPGLLELSFEVLIPAVIARGLPLRVAGPDTSDRPEPPGP